LEAPLRMDVIDSANEFFHSIYSEAISATLKVASRHPIVIAEGEFFREKEMF
jgi:hypothetical protein